VKLGFTTLGCPDWDMGQIVAAAAECGYDGVDFRGYGQEMAVYRLAEFTTDAAATARRFADAGVEVCGFSSGARLFDPDRARREAHLEEVRAYADLCAAFGAPRIRVFGGRLEGTGPAEAIEVAAETAAAMAAAAGGATVTVETHDDWTDSHLLADLFGRIDAANVDICWDVHHPFREHGETPAETWANIGRWVGYTHVKDGVATEGGKHTYTLPGEGDVPLAEAVAVLSGGGYDGYLTLEWEKRWRPEIPGPEEAFPAYATYLRGVLQ
jgi:sugar phosphate isomerase/epimerase